VPEWVSSYINYKGLKKLIKSAAEAAKAGKDVDLAGKGSWFLYRRIMLD
jgi:glycerophosphodiester phosphodiesterase